MPSEKTFNYPVRIGSASEYGQVLADLNNKLDNIKRKISYFDTYNITATVSDSSVFSAQINSLPANEALVINCNPFSYNGESFVPGDIVLKISSGQIVHIKSLTGGVYYPSKVQGENNSFTIQYTFSGAAPTMASSIVETPGSEASLAKDIIFKNLTTENPTNIYGLWEQMESNTYEFDAYVTNNEANDDYVVRPFIQFYLCVNGVPVEQVFLEYSLTLNTEGSLTWVITLDEELASGDIYIKVK